MPIKYGDKYLSPDYGEINTKKKGEIKEFIYQTNWPPGYSLLIMLLLSIGFLPLTAGLIGKAICILMALGGLLSLARELFETLSFKLLYIITVSGFIYIYYKISPSDLLILGFFCYLSKIIVSQKYLGIEIKYCINIGLLMACAIAFKYSAIFIMLCTFIYICISRIYLKQKDRLLIKLTLTLLPSIFILIAIFNYNLFQTGTLSKNIVSMKIYLSDLPISWLIAPFDALFFKTTMINSGFIRNLFFNNTFLIATLKTLIVLIFVSIIFILIKNNNSLKLYKLLFLFLSGFLANFLFLFSLTFLFLDRNAIWTPVEDGRYYLPLLPLLFAIVFLLLEKKINIKFFKNSAKKIILVILVFIYLWAVCFFEIYWNKNIKFIRNTSFEVLKEIQYLKENNPLHKIVIFSDEDFHRSSLNFIPAAIFYLEPYNTEWKTLIDGKAIVLLICIPTYRLNHQKSDDNCKSMNYKNSASLFGFDTYREWNNNLIFVKRYD